MYWDNRVVPQTEKFNKTQPITRLTEGPTIVVRADCSNVPTPSPTELTRNNSIEDGRAEPKAKACHLLQEALRLVEGLLEVDGTL